MCNGKIFYDYLKDELNEHFVEFGKEIYKDGKSWTQVITKNPYNKRSLIDKVLYKMFEKAKSSNEYYHIDNSVYVDIEGGYEKRGKNRLHKWKLMAAIEHENDYRDWTYELVKLTYINCPLRVVISYGDYDKEYKDSIKIAEEIAEKIKLSDYVTDKQEYILIFGPRSKNIKNKKATDIPNMYMAFKWDGKKFKQL